MNSYVLFLGVALQCFATFYFIGKTSTINKEVSIFNKCIGLIVFIFCTICSHLYFSLAFKLIYTGLSSVILYNIVFKENFKFSLIKSLLLFTGFIIYDFLTAIFLMEIMQSNNELYQEIGFYWIIVFAVFISILLIILGTFQALRKAFVDLSKLLNEVIINVFQIAFQFIIYIVFSLLISQITFKDNFQINLIILFIFCGLYLIVTQINMYKYQRSKFLKEKLVDLNINYVKRIENDRIYKHNIKNKLISVKSIGGEKVKKAINEIIYEENINESNVIRFNEVPKSFLVVFYDKLSNLDYITISISNDLCYDPIDKMSFLHYTRAIESIGIILDNVKEALADLEDAFIHIHFIELKGYLCIKISNNYNGNLDIDNLGNINYSTKKEKSGIGLYTLLNLKHVNIQVILYENVFVTKLLVKTKNKSTI